MSIRENPPVDSNPFFSYAPLGGGSTSGYSQLGEARRGLIPTFVKQKYHFSNSKLIARINFIQAPSLFGLVSIYEFALAVDTSSLGCFHTKNVASFLLFVTIF